MVLLCGFWRVQYMEEEETYFEDSMDIISVNIVHEWVSKLWETVQILESNS